MAELYGSSLMETTNEMGSGSGRDDDDDVAVDDDAHSRYGSSLVEITHEVEAKEVGKMMMILMVPNTDPSWQRSQSKSRRSKRTR